MLKPLGDRILVENIEMAKKTKSGIILSDTSTNQEINKARIVAVSNEVSKLKLDDIIYYSKYKGENIKYDEVDYVILDLKDVLAKEEK